MAPSRTKKWLKRLGSCSLISMVLMMITLGFASSCISFSMKQEKVDAFFEAKKYQPRYHQYQFEGRTMNYVEIGDPTLPPVVFVHGSPGSWDAFIGYMGYEPLLEKAHLISVDRPGFGKSGRGKPEKSLVKQAASIMAALACNQSGKPAVLVGHSYGGPVIAQMAVDFPEQVGSLIMIAASVDPELEETKWFQIPADWLVFSWMVPKDLRTSNREILPLRGELQKLLPRWPEIKIPVTIIQGEKDGLVPPANADFAQKQLVNATIDMVRKQELNHFIPWTQPQLIRVAVDHHLKLLTPTEVPESYGQ